ncbi:MAG: hypothetical protein AB8H80_05435 [Planctomycetota bacterium]
MLATTLTSTLCLALLQAPQGTPSPPPPRPGIAWQRSLDDALAAQKQTGLPLLIAVNMNGEVFNERFAATTYRDPAFIESTRGYICVVASPDRHTERDYDALGNRIECPRFGGCTCSEHQQIEPTLYDRYFNGRRNAPRHVGVSPSGKILFDRYLDSSMQTAVNAIAKNRGKADALHLAPSTKLAELFQRRDALARQLLEQRYRAADEKNRKQLLTRAAKATNDPVDLLRMGLHDPSEMLRGTAAMALSEVGGANALIDIEDALARITDVDIKKRLIAQLRRIGKDDPAAARLASHFGAPDDKVAKPWRNAWRKTPLLDGRQGIESELDRVEAALKTDPKSPLLRLDLATAQAAFALQLMAEGGTGIELWFADAQRNAKRVRTEALEPEARALEAITAWFLNEPEAAQKAATESMARADSDRSPADWLASNLLDVVLQMTAQTAFARGQQDETASVSAELSRTRSVLALLTERSAGGERANLTAISLLEYAGLRAEARLRLADAAIRFPLSTAVHERWRNRMLVDLGAERMRADYANYANRAPDKATAQWFAGYAALVAAERHTADSRWIEARNAYDDSIERFLDSCKRNDAYRDTAEHYAVLGLTGRAWVRHQRGEAKGAVADIERAAGLRPASLDEDDGLARKPRGIGDRIRRALEGAGKTELAQRLAAIL